MSAFSQMPYPEYTLTFIGSIAAVIGIWSMLILERVFVKGVPGEPRPSNKKPVLFALVITLALSGLAWMTYTNLQAKASAHFVALGHRACRSWSFASAIPEQPFAATIMGRYEGIAGYTCADVSEHFFDLGSGRAVKEPPGFYGHLSSDS
jgi:hypothetical protein